VEDTGVDKEKRKCCKLTCPTRSESELKAALQSPHMHVTIGGWVFITGEGNLIVFGIVAYGPYELYESIFDSIGVRGNPGLADAAELPDDIDSGFMMSCELYEPLCTCRALGYTESSDTTSPQSQNMSSREEL
jgi:hypothetical protein